MQVTLKNTIHFRLSVCFYYKKLGDSKGLAKNFNEMLAIFKMFHFVFYSPSLV